MRAKINDLGIKEIQTTVPMEMVATPSRILGSIYTLSDLGDLSNLIGSLSRTIQH